MPLPNLHPISTTPYIDSEPTLPGVVCIRGVVVSCRARQETIIESVRAHWGTMSTDGSPTLQSSYRSLANPAEFEDFLSRGEALADRNAWAEATDYDHFLEMRLNGESASEQA